LPTGFSTERVLAVLHLMEPGSLPGDPGLSFGAVRHHARPLPRYFPTIAPTHLLTLRQVKNASSESLIRVLGTLGWTPSAVTTDGWELRHFHAVSAGSRRRL
jgi:hypothetical protein